MHNTLFDKIHLPIGPRIIKTILAVFISISIVELRDGFAFYAAASAILCLKPDKKMGFTTAIQRITGTLVGGFFSLILFYFIHLFNIEFSGMMENILISLFLIPILYTNKTLNKPEISIISCVVFLSVTMIHFTKEIPEVFVLNRIIDTLIGVICALFVNMFPPHYDQQN